jgi:hypothetical protein
VEHEMRMRKGKVHLPQFFMSFDAAGKLFHKKNIEIEKCAESEFF